MRFADADIFSPNAAPPDMVGLPPPGPTSDWTAEGVISVLSEMALPERVERMDRVLAARTQDVTVVLENPYDPHNISAVLRSCDAFGVQDVHIVGSRARLAAANKVTKGSHQWIDLYHHEQTARGAQKLADAGYELVMTHPEGVWVPSDLARIPKLALVFGNEHEGISEEVRGFCSGTVRIPMCGFVESLNLSVSAAILLQAATQDRPRGLPEPVRANLLARWLRASVPRSAEILAAFDAR